MSTQNHAGDDTQRAALLIVTLIVAVVVASVVAFATLRTVRTALRTELEALGLARGGVHLEQPQQPARRALGLGHHRHHRVEGPLIQPGIMVMDDQIGAARLSVTNAEASADAEHPSRRGTGMDGALGDNCERGARRQGVPNRGLPDGMDRPVRTP